MHEGGGGVCTFGSRHTRWACLCTVTPVHLCACVGVYKSVAVLVRVCVCVHVAEWAPRVSMPAGVASVRLVTPVS